MEVRYFDILCFLRRFSSDCKYPIERFVSAFVLQSLYDYQLRDSSILSYVWMDLNDSKLDLYDVQKFIECYGFKRGLFDMNLRICVNMIKAIYTAWSAV